MDKKNSFVFSMCLMCTLSTSLSYAQIEAVQVENNFTVIKGESGARITNSNLGVENFVTAKKIITPNNTSTQIPHNREFGTLYFSILSPTKSELVIRWDNQEYMFSRFDSDQNIRFFRPGASRQISFNVTKPMSGFIYIYNTKNQLLKKIPYSVSKQSSFSHGVTTRLNTSDNNDDDYSQGYSINYSISKRSPVGKPRWRGGATFRSDFNNPDGNDDKSGSVYLGVTW